MDLSDLNRSSPGSDHHTDGKAAHESDIGHWRDLVTHRSGIYILGFTLLEERRYVESAVRTDTTGRACRRGC